VHPPGYTSLPPHFQDHSPTPRLHLNEQVCQPVPPERRAWMAYREVRMMDIDQVIRRWLAGEKIRAIARLTSTDRNTVRRIVRLAEETGIRGETPWPDEGKLQLIRQRMGRPGAAVATSGAEQQLKSRTE